MTTPASSTPSPTFGDEESPSAAYPAQIRLSPERIEAMRAEVRRRLAAKRRSRRLVAPDPPPRYDEAFFRFVAWLNGEDGPLP